MKPSNFKESTIELKKPLDMADEECGSLHICQTKDGQCVSLWKATLWERIKFLFHGNLWLGVISGRTQPPVWLDMIKSPFIKETKWERFTKKYLGFLKEKRA